MLLTHAEIQTVADGVIHDGFIQIEGRAISAVGAMQHCPADGFQLDLSGCTVYPGFIDAHCHMGLWEDSLGFEGADGNEDTDPLTPQLNALDAINPMDRCFAEAVAAGVTTVVAGPGSANPIGGAWVALKTYGRRVDDMVLAVPVGIKFALGENPKSVYHDKNQTPVTRMATAALIREQLEKAKRYLQQLQKSEQDEDQDAPEYDAKCEALIPLLQGKTKAFFHAHRADDLFTAIRIAKEYQLDLVLVHATEGRLVADLLAQEHAKIVAGPLICDRSKPELHQLSLQTPGVLADRNCPIAICTDHPELPIQYLTLSCGLAVREGLSRELALRAITLTAAQICGIDQRVGSIEAGKDADLAVYAAEDDPFSVYAKPQKVFINGKLVFEEKNES